MPLWIKEKLFQKNYLFNKLKEQDNKYLSDDNIFFSDHHLSHAASAFFPSPFEEAVVLTADGVGEWATTTVAIGKGSELEIYGNILTETRCDCGLRMYQDNRKPAKGSKPNRVPGFWCKICDAFASMIKLQD